MALDPYDLIGTWRLERWEVERADGSVGRPLGARPQGIAIYGEDGWMSTTMTAGDRPTLSGPNARNAPEPERAAAFSSLLAYSCRWRVEGDAVLHLVEVAHNPAMVGTTQSRRASVEGDAMVFTTGDHASGGLHRLWKRRVAETEA